MAELTKADLIWNRACYGDVASVMAGMAGDLALGALLLAHGYVMNGGVFHAVECLGAELTEEAESGYRYFGFQEIAELLGEARSILKAANDSDLSDIELGKRYTAAIPDDSTLFERFEDCLRRNPSEFAPL